MIFSMIIFFLLTCGILFSLDKINSNENLNKDILDYITLRISTSSPIHNNVSSSVTGKLEGPSSSASATRFSHHLLSLSKGSILFAKLTLDLLERGHLVVKSSGYKVCSLFFCKQCYINIWPSFRFYLFHLLKFSCCISICVFLRSGLLKKSCRF